MKTLHKTLLMALSLGFILTSAAPAQDPKGIAACVVVTATNCTGSPGMRVCTLRRNVGGGTMMPSCVTTVEVNANCSIMTAGYVLTFNAAQTGTNPSCQWSCTACPTVTMDTSTGLPVELLGFEIEGGEATGEPPSDGGEDDRDDERG